MSKYYDQMMLDNYRLLSARKVSWPYELDNAQKVELLEKTLMYFEEAEDYVKCAVLVKKIKSINRTTKQKHKLNYSFKHEKYPPL